MQMEQYELKKWKESCGFYSKIDLGIVKYHFETGAGTENCEWV